MTMILVDASGYIYRAFFSQPAMQRSDGFPTGCIHGYCKMLWGLKRKYVTASHFAVVFDKGKSKHRVDLWPEYKAHRAPMHDDLRAQLGVVRDATRAFGFPVVEADNIEADDLIASYAETMASRGDDVTIVSVDKDMMQLMRPGVEMYDPVKDRVLTTEDVIAKLGVPPELAVDAQALIGDASDNVPGVPGIGAKTAGQLLAAHGSLEDLLANWQLVSKPKIRDSLMLHRDQARLSKLLVTLIRDVELPVPLKDLEARDVDVRSLVEFAKSMEFASFGADVEAFYGALA